MDTREIIEMILESGRGFNIEIRPSFQSRTFGGLSTSENGCELRISVYEVEDEDDA